MNIVFYEISSRFYFSFTFLIYVYLILNICIYLCYLHIIKILDMDFKIINNNLFLIKIIFNFANDIQKRLFLNIQTNITYKIIKFLVYV